MNIKEEKACRFMVVNSLHVGHVNIFWYFYLSLLLQENK